MSSRIVHFLASSLVVAASSLTIAISQAPAAPAKNEKMICRTEATAGSRLGKSRVCRTAQEWAELRRQTQANIDRIQNGRVWDSHNCPSPGSCD
jgi:hypothetical protein